MEGKTVRISYCKICGGWVSMAAWNMMDAKSKSDFFKEVVKYDLEDKTYNYDEYLKLEKTHYCNTKH